MGLLRHKVLWGFEAITKRKSGSLANLRAAAVLMAANQRGHGEPAEQGPLSPSPDAKALAQVTMMGKQSAIGAV